MNKINTKTITKTTILSPINNPEHIKKYIKDNYEDITEITINIEVKNEKASIRIATKEKAIRYKTTHSQIEELYISIMEEQVELLQKYQETNT